MNIIFSLLASAALGALYTLVFDPDSRGRGTTRGKMARLRKDVEEVARVTVHDFRKRKTVDLLQQRWSVAARFLFGSACAFWPLLAGRKRKAAAAAIVVAALGLAAYALSETNGLSRRPDHPTGQDGGADAEQIAAWGA